MASTLTLSEQGGADYAHPLGLPHLKYSVITPLFLHLHTVFPRIASAETILF